MSAKAAPTTLWSPSATPDARALAFTIGDDPHWDSQLLRWDVIGSLGHIAGLRSANILSPVDHQRLHNHLLSALSAVESGELFIAREHEDGHTAVELWLSQRDPELGARLHTGRSRNDQIAVDLRLFMKSSLQKIVELAGQLATVLLDFAAQHRQTLWPGFTHQRRAMPSSLGLWSAALAEGLIDTIETHAALLGQIDRSPLGSAAGYGVPLSLDREATAQALGFAGLVQVVTAVQNGRGKLEAALLFFCTQLGHDLSRLCADVCLYSAEEFGFLILPADLATGSSLMPHKRNPDVFELGRAKMAALDGDLTQLRFLAGKLSSGYHRDFQLMKEPLLRGVQRTMETLDVLQMAIPKLGVDKDRCLAALSGNLLVTDEVIRRVESGQPFRTAYRSVADELKRDALTLPIADPADLIRRRRSTGGMGNLGLPKLRTRLRHCLRQNEKSQVQFRSAIDRLLQPMPTHDSDTHNPK
ncbi:MAG TPA: lyase family protein [Pseudomonadota bacterium]|nr:lyase family protein [Pseudomonadota bacterium]